MKYFYLLFLTTFILSQDDYLVTIPATSYTDWVYYSFETHSIVDIENPENSLDWDIGLQRKHIRSNSGLSGIGMGGGYVDSTKTWIDHWSTMTYLPEDLAWHTDEMFYDFYDLTTHTYVEGIENPALRTWGWFDLNFQLIPTNYIMFLRCANGEDIAKLWIYDYYNGGGGNIAIRYQTGFNQLANINNDELRFNLGNAYPNPFNPTTNFNIEIPTSEYVEVNIYNMQGHKVQNLVSGILDAGKHNLTWNANDMPSGIYFIKLDYSNQSNTQKVILMK